MKIIKITTQKEWDELPNGFEEYTTLEIYSVETIVIRKNPRNSSARLFNNSSARLYNNSSARLYDNSSAKLYNNSSVELYNNSSARLYDNSSAGLFNNSSARLYNNSSARLYDNSSAALYDNSSAELLGSSSVELCNNSSAALYDNSSAALWDNSSAELLGSSSVSKAFDSSCIWKTTQKVGFIDKGVTIKELNYKSSFETLLEHNILRVDGITKEIKLTKKLDDTTTLYLLEDDTYCAQIDGSFAHGDTIKQSLADLSFKLSNRDKSSYENLTQDHVFKFEEAVECYRVITGACSSGVRDFLKQNNVSEDDISIKEIMTLTKDAYMGGVFKLFFNERRGER